MHWVFYLLRSLLCSLSFPSRRRSSTMDLREEVHELLGSIERYNPNNLDIFIEYAKATVRRASEKREISLFSLCFCLFAA